MSNASAEFADALKIDLYELTMAAGYFENKIQEEAVFELFCHTMPAQRSYLVSCGLQQAVDYILNLRFSSADLQFLKSLPAFKNVSERFFQYLKKFRRARTPARVRAILATLVEIECG